MLKVNKEFVKQNLDRWNKKSMMGFNITRDGIYFCDPNTLNEFPKIFNFQPETIEILETDVFDSEGQAYKDYKVEANREKSKNPIDRLKSQ